MNILDKPKNTLNKLILKVFMSFEHIVLNFRFFFYLLGNKLNTFFYIQLFTKCSICLTNFSIHIFQIGLFRKNKQSI